MTTDELRIYGIDIHTVSPGDVVYVRTIVTRVQIDDWTTTISVKDYTDYGSHGWESKSVNSVDVFKVKP